MLKDNKKLYLGIKIAVFILVFISITFISSKITAYVTNDNPPICRGVNLKINDANLSEDGKLLKINIKNLGDQNINGFNILIVSEKINVKQKIFTTVKKGTDSNINIDYNKNDYGNVKRITLTPVIIEATEVNYCTNVISYNK